MSLVEIDGSLGEGVSNYVEEISVVSIVFLLGRNILNDLGYMPIEKK